MEKIWSYAPYASLMALRRVNTAFHQRADYILSRHIAVNGRWGQLSSIRGRLPGMLTAYRGSGSVGAWPWDDRVFSGVEAVDIFVLECGYAACDELAHHLRNVGTIRLWPRGTGGLWAFQPETFVVFTWPAPPIPSRLPDRLQHPAAITLSDRGSRRVRKVPSRVRKVIINLSIDPCLGINLKSRQLTYPTITDIVIIFRQSPPRQDMAKCNILREVLNIFRTALMAPPDTKFTFVNSHIVQYPNVALLDTKIVEDIQFYFPEVKTEDCLSLETLARAVTPEVGRDCFRFLTLDEYEAEVGPEQYRLETQESYSLR